MLYDFVNSSDLLMYFPPSPTHYPQNGGTPSTLDMFLIRGSIDASDPVTYNDLSSDHLPVHCYIASDVAKRTHVTQVKDYENANWVTFQQHIRSDLVDLSIQIDSIEAIDNRITNLTHVMIMAEAAAVPRKRIIKSAPKLPAHVRTL